MTLPLLSAVLDPPPPEKAYLVAEHDFSDKIELQFNPETLTISRDVNWKEPCDSATGQYSTIAYGGSGADKLEVRVILDTSMPKDPFGLKAAATQAALMVPGASPGTIMDVLLKSDPDSVTDTIDKLVKWTYPTFQATPDDDNTTTGSIARPPAVAFMWGSHIKFFGAIQSLKFELTLFDSDGTPVRAVGSISLIGRREGPDGSELEYVKHLFHDKAAARGSAPTKSTAKTSEADSVAGL